MTICIDCRMIDASGIGVYLRGCLPWFLQSKNDFLLIGNSGLLHDFTSNENIKIIECNINPFSLRELLFFPIKTTRQINQADLYFSPFFNIPKSIKIPVFTTIHDIIFFDMPNLVSKPGLLMRIYFYKRAARLSKAIFTVSEFSKSRIKHFLGDSLNVINASNAVNAPFQTALKNLPEKKKNILFIGNIKKHKGLNLLLDAFLQCKEEGLDYGLVIVGSRNNFRSGDKKTSRRLDSLERHGIIFSGYISDAEKWKLLAESALLVQPSLYEGFGYPPLEAMLSGTQALISDISVFKEVYSDFPVRFFRAEDRRDLHDKLLEILSGKNPQTIYLNDTLIKKYTFEKTVSVILKELESSRNTP